ncbi:unnamed protein product, partial [marine sediment metagenome]
IETQQNLRQSKRFAHIAQSPLQRNKKTNMMEIASIGSTPADNIVPMTVKNAEARRTAQLHLLSKRQLSISGLHLEVAGGSNIPSAYKIPNFPTADNHSGISAGSSVAGVFDSIGKTVEQNATKKITSNVKSLRRTLKAVLNQVTSQMAKDGNDNANIELRQLIMDSADISDNIHKVTSVKKTLDSLKKISEKYFTGQQNNNPQETHHNQVLDQQMKALDVKYAKIEQGIVDITDVRVKSYKDAYREIIPAQGTNVSMNDRIKSV